MSLPGSKLQFLRNPENLSEISRIFEKSSKLLDGLLLRQSFIIQSGSSLAVHEKNQILRLITAEIQRGIAQVKDSSNFMDYMVAQAIVNRSEPVTSKRDY